MEIPEYIKQQLTYVCAQFAMDNNVKVANVIALVSELILILNQLDEKEEKVN